MLNQHVLEYCSSIYDFLKGLPLSLFAATFAIYFAYMKISNKVAFSYSVSFRESGDKLTDFILKNQRDKTYSIKKILCKLNDGNLIILKDFQPPLLLKPFETALVEFDDVSMWLDKEGVKYHPDYSELFEITLLLHSGGSVKCINKYHSDYKEATISPYVSRFDGLILTQNMKFVMKVVTDNKTKDLIIYSHGWIEGDAYFGGYNCLNKEDVSLYRIVEIISEKKFNLSWDYYVVFEINDFRVKKVYDSRCQVELSNT
ncbi:Uncharacterised protein [Buttiauxella agrestis]|uniref:Uncharacterized protein n=1 Tax=Buttiauxella agrestis TaxID=82977 RepID=A0A381C977_9ENTR|nr:hypothetical protein [Buttiauxella agrestis]SUW63533.1 Uncharacterised protein [Buttiauxella agrestis]